MPRLKRSIIFTLVVSAMVATACTPEQILAITRMSPEQVVEVEACLAEPTCFEQVSPAKTCREAADRYWPKSSRGWVDKTLHAESRGDHRAANKASTARGCMQLLQSLHSWRYREVGCDPSDWNRPGCNVLAALHLYNEQGPRPWMVG